MIINDSILYTGHQVGGHPDIPGVTWVPIEEPAPFGAVVRGDTTVGGTAGSCRLKIGMGAVYAVPSQQAYQSYWAIQFFVRLDRCEVVEDSPLFAAGAVTEFLRDLEAVARRIGAPV